mmetsp:Transcript_14250/g.29940  ORF Transcript_14250/g.29940 Transcript_14250/m.29940 type:complete len:508 (-) Transcript_14250:297-1820(-)|eukprot:CAMPEP_0171338668 /NCGR_PEP_ID=MMETSP0878-20121228/7464_1 /TAXON_ID=67004 /ORGANISM="Thalassiosira weissflogii, Strain CCMP1336" /LENGTH=507 /DNA_ID=CAMNT_0011840473 /DNA_START=240 /DNA_END=1763 /DNA_ORIENTATION=+
MAHHQPHNLRYVSAPYHHPAYGRPPVVVTDNDVLCGRGVNIAAHPGNERFRTLVTTRADENYCETYSASEKKALADEIVRHIASLDPPGRFLKREGRGQISRGLNGPWEELSHKEAVKKTCQALRDCNRNDRATYAAGVAPPEDVKQVAEERAKSGLTGKDLAAKAAEQLREENHKLLREAMEAAGVAPEQIEEQLRRKRADPTYIIPGFSMSGAGIVTPLTFGHVPSGMPMGGVGPDGMPIPASDPMSTVHVPVLYTPFPHPAIDAAPIDEAAQAAARAAAGYVHPNDRLAGAAEEAAAAVTEMDTAAQEQQELAQQVANTAGEVSAEAQEAAEIAVAIAHDAVDALTNEESTAVKNEGTEGVTYNENAAAELQPEAQPEGQPEETHVASNEMSHESHATANERTYEVANNAHTFESVMEDFMNYQAEHGTKQPTSPTCDPANVAPYEASNEKCEEMHQEATNEELAEAAQTMEDYVPQESTQISTEPMHGDLKVEEHHKGGEVVV